MDNHDGTMTATAKYDDADSLTITNTYAAEGFCELEATKSINDWGLAESFTFTLAPVGEAPMPGDAAKVEETVTDEETGKKKKTKKTVNVTDGNFCSPYARVFDCGSRCWEKDPESNLYFLRAEQEHFTNKLRSRGYLTLNEVYERLDIPVTKAGQIVGWVYDPEDPNLHNYVDLGIYDITREKVRDFINGYEENILLDPNVDGDILDLIPKYQK